MPNIRQNRLRRMRRTRSKIHGTAVKPRMSVHRSHLHLSVQLIDDDAGKTLAAANTKELKTGGNKEGAKKLGAAIAKKAKDLKVDTVTFDRGRYRYHGCVKEIADAAREGGLQF